ncbi:hypothetical protein [Sphingomicrobium sediminis]|uniref:17 kDa surface antigen n=1 Tax=Sphingomicrobium sediminis TaxID=2950949 RepID=A0A9X2ELF0_9SPHN|nr:hypothetical protein [Sphingomicrobium sediminis]MCM8557614.1 hypothetical protein [Sphingomicrobium sediminis]
MAKFLKMAVPAAGMIAASAALASPAQAQGYDRDGRAAERIVGAVLSEVLGGQPYYRDRYDRYDRRGIRGEREAVDRCARRVDARILRDYRGRYGPGGQVTDITHVERTRYGWKVYGTATSGRNVYGYDRYSRYDRNSRYNRYDRRGGDLNWNCEIEYNGRIRDTDVDRNDRYDDRRYRNYGYRY